MAFSSSLYKMRPDSVLNGSMHNAAQPLVGVQMLYYQWNRLIEGKWGKQKSVVISGLTHWLLSFPSPESAFRTL